MAQNLRSDNTILANMFCCQSQMNHLELKCNVQCSCNCICGPLLQLCRLRATKLKKNVIVAACVKHGNTCISSIFFLFCGGRQFSQGLFGGRGCANLIASLTVKLFDVIALLQIELSHYNYLL